MRDKFEKFKDFLDHYYYNKNLEIFRSNKNKIKSFFKFYEYEDEELEDFFINISYLMHRRKIYIVRDIINKAIKKDFKNLNDFRSFLIDYDKSKQYKKINYKKRSNERGIFKWQT